MHISLATTQDIPPIATLYRRVAAQEGGLARVAAEVTDDYVEDFVTTALRTGFSFIARDDARGPILGEIHTLALGPKVFAHVLGDLTIAVAPEAQGKGVGKRLFRHLLRAIETERPDILRIELLARESNRHAIALYQKLGFKIEGHLEGRIRSVGGGYEADIPMAYHFPPR